MRRTLVAVVTAALLTTLAALPAGATGDLVARQRQLRQDAQAARASIEAETIALGEASQALLAAQERLAEARAALDDTRHQLDAARLVEAELAQRLADERAQLERDRLAVRAAEQRVDDQQALITRVARDAYQQRSGLTGLGVVFGSTSTDQLAQRVQWDTTVFDTSQARLDTLNRLRADLAAARDRQAATAAKVAADQAEAARTVARVESLVDAAATLEREVADLVVAHEQARAAAQAELDAEQARYDELMAEDARISQQLMGLVARGIRYVTDVPPGQVWTDHATYPVLASGPQVAVSPKGFTRPLAARPGSPFGMRFHPILKRWRMHNGTDYGAPCGMPLYAAQAGRVVQARSQGGFGNYTIIDHGLIGRQRVMTGYAHQERMVVRPGQFVSQGQLIGHVGTTGLSTGCHLHLQVYVNGTPSNPLAWIP